MILIDMSPNITSEARVHIRNRIGLLANDSPSIFRHVYYSL